MTVNLVANTTSRVETIASGTYYYRIRSFNQGGYSTYVVATPFPIVTP